MADVGAKLIGQFADCRAEELASGNVAGSTVAAPTAESSATADAAAEPVETSATAPLPPTTSATPEAAPAPATPLPPRPAQAAQAPAQPITPRKPAEPIDLLEVAGGSVAKRLAPVALALLLLLLLVVIVQWHRRTHRCWPRQQVRVRRPRRQRRLAAGQAHGVYRRGRWLNNTAEPMN